MKDVKNEARQAVWKDIIIGYRQLIEERYQYDALCASFNVPETFTKEKVEKFRNYFLEQVYPHPDKRIELNEAFESLEKFTRNPSKLIRLVLDSSSLMFKFGMQLRKLSNAGMNALQSFRAANKFEDKLVDNAILFEMETPISKEDVNYLISTLPEQEIEKFIDSTESLLKILHDRELVEKIITIIDKMISKMKNRPKVYSKADVTGLEMGFDVVKKGNELFNDLTEEEQSRIFDLVIEAERSNLYEIFNS